MSRPSTVSSTSASQRRRSRHRLVATVLIVMLSARMMDITDGLTTTPRPESESTQDRAESGDFLAMSDVGTGTETNSRDFKVPRSVFDEYCANGECVQGDVLKVVSKMAKRILSDPRILGLRTATEPEEDITDAPDESAARSIGVNNFDTRPFSSSDYYYENRNRIDRYSDPEAYPPTSPSSHTNYRQRDRYSEAYVDSSEQQQQGTRSPPSAAPALHDRDSSYGYGGGDSYSGGDSYGGGESYGGGSSYGGGGGYGGGYGGYESCCQNNKLLPVLLVGLLGILAFFLYIRSTTTAARRSFDDNDLSDGNLFRAILD